MQAWKDEWGSQLPTIRLSTELASQRGQPTRMQIYLTKRKESPSNLIIAKRAAGFTHPRVRQKPTNFGEVIQF